MANIERLFRFLAAKNPDAVRRAVQAVRDKINFLARHPRLGRIDYEQPDERELRIAFRDSGYVARYRLEGGTVIILAIRHAREADPADQRAGGGRVGGRRLPHGQHRLNRR